MLSSEYSSVKARHSLYFIKSERATQFPLSPFTGLFLKFIMNGMVGSLPDKLLPNRHHYPGTSQYSDETGIYPGVRSTKNQILISPFTNLMAHGQISKKLRNLISSLVK